MPLDGLPGREGAMRRPLGARSRPRRPPAWGPGHGSLGDSPHRRGRGLRRSGRPETVPAPPLRVGLTRLQDAGRGQRVTARPPETSSRRDGGRPGDVLRRRRLRPRGKPGRHPAGPFQAGGVRPPDPAHRGAPRDALTLRHGSLAVRTGAPQGVFFFCQARRGHASAQPGECRARNVRPPGVG